MNDEQLILEFQQGSTSAFSEIFATYRDPIYRFFRRRLENPSRAEELTQECFLALFRNRSRYEPRATFRSYLYGIASNMLFAERRKAAREIASDESKVREMPDPAARSVDAALWVRQALQRLNETDREILMLREYEQLNYEEIGSLLRLPINTVRSRLFRARLALKDELLSSSKMERGIR
jgi:RNA polymerase sigma-70 factor (ECF subfamily)